MKFVSNKRTNAFIEQKIMDAFLLPCCVPMFDTHLKMSFVKTKKMLITKKVMLDRS